MFVTPATLDEAIARSLQLGAQDILLSNCSPSSPTRASCTRQRPPACPLMAGA